MKFKKRILSEEIGLKKTNKKTFTKNKKQKVVISEEQLQRLIGKIKNPRVIKEIDLTWYIKFLEGVLKEWEKDGGKITDPNAWTNFKTQNQATFAQLGDRAPKSFAELKRMGGRTPNPPKIPLSTDTKGLKEQKQNINEIMYWIGIASALWGLWKVWSADDNPFTGKTTGGEDGWDEFVAKNRSKFNELKKASGKMPNSPRELERMSRMSEDEPTVDFSTDNKPQTSPVKKKCCKCRGQKPYSLAHGKRCPKSCPEVPCKGTPPTNPGGVTEGRRLKTTNPITESEIKDMKKWFNRVNKAGREYNPVKL